MSPENAAVADDRWHLEDERDFLVRSLADAEREYQAGDMGDDDYEALSRRDRERLEAVDAALRELDVAAAVSGAPTRDRDAAPAPASTPASTPASARRHAASASVPGDDPAPGRRWRWRRRRWVAITGSLAIVAGVVLLAVHLTSTRLPGQEITGGQVLSSQAQVQKELAQAADEENDHNLVEAIKLYNAILVTDPDQPQALAERGWLEYEGGEAAGTRSLMAKGTSSIDKALSLDPKDYAPHLYLGTIDLQQDSSTDAAVTQYQTFLRLDPPKKVVEQAAPYIRQAFEKAGKPVPAGL